MTEAALNKVDARTQSPAALLERRQLVVRLHQEGVPVMQIVSQSGLHWATVKAAIERYTAGGDSALMPAARGRKPGTGRTLSTAQEAELRQYIGAKRPLFYGLDDALWSRDAVARLIVLKFATTLSVRGVSNYLTRWGVVLKNPDTKPYERCTGPVKTWLDANYADIERQAQAAQAELYWINKPVVLDAALWCGAPVKRRLLVSAANNQGTLKWAIIDGAFNPDQQNKFVAGLVKDTIGRRRRPLFLIRSDTAMCSSGEFMTRITTCKAKVRLFP